MNGNVSRRNGAGLGGALLAAVVVVWLMIEGAGALKAKTPEDAVRAIYQHCQGGSYGETARYYLGGPQRDAAMRESICKKITLGGQAQGWEIKSVHALAKETVIESLSYRDASTKTGGRIITWRLVQKRGGWVVGEV